MKETIYTIPINEAFGAECGCPLCYLRGKLEQERIKYTLGASMMEPDSRAVTNTMGFCSTHYALLMEQPNKLSFALVMETHLADLRKRLDSCRQNVAPSKKKPKFGKADSGNAILLSHTLNSIINSCAICDYINSTLERYLEVIFHMWANDTEFRRRFDEAEYICLPHYKLLAQNCSKHLDKVHTQSFLKELYERQQAYLESLQADIHHFTQKFDYRNADMPWGNAQDAPKRAAKVLGGE